MQKALAKTTEPAPDHSIVANEYGYYCMPNSYRHREICAHLIDGAVYEPATLNFLRRHIGTGDIVTGGAFIGDFFPALHEVLAPKALIHSFEPNPISVEAAKETIRLNGLKKIKLHAVAVGDEPAQLMLKVNRYDGSAIAAGERIVEDMREEDPRGISVPTVMIDDLIPKTRKVSVLHLDVEGFEIKALQGAKGLVRKNKPLVILESGKPWQQRRFCEILNTICDAQIYTHVGTIEHNAIYRPV